MDIVFTANPIGKIGQNRTIIYPPIFQTPTDNNP